MKPLRLIFDIETNGLLPDVSKLHCIVIVNADTFELTSYADQPGYTPLAVGLALLTEADELIGHNIVGYDLPVIEHLVSILKHLFPGWKPKEGCRLTDTMILAKLLFGDIKDKDFSVRNAQLDKGQEPSLPGQMIGRHSLEAWGYRLGEMKGDYTKWCKENGIDDPWAIWRPEMHLYCEQDGRVTLKLFLMIVRKHDIYGEWAKAIDIETRFAALTQKQEAHGFRFDVKAAEKLEATLRIEKAAQADKLYSLFAPWWVKTGTMTPAPKANLKTWVSDEEIGGQVRTVKEETGETYAHTFKTGKQVTRLVKREVDRRGFVQTVSPEGFTRVELRVFNPGSRQHIADRLMKLYGWVPAEYTPSGEVQVDDDILSALPYPPAAALAKFFMLEKRLGQIADGKQAWLKVQRKGRIHGRVNTLGAITGRCTHSDPNVAQTPSIENANGKVPYGGECRACWVADEGHVLIGCDADGLELRCLAHFMVDGGRYSKIVDEGNKDEGTDIHTMNMKAAELNSRANAKTFIYAFLYGAGDEKIGSIVGGGSEAGKKLKAQFLKGTPGLKGLISAVKAAAKEKGWIRGIDGRRVTVRHQHAALNTLLQNAGAVAMKLAPVLLYERLTAEGLQFGKDWAQVAHVHDELQISSRPEHADHIKQAAVWSIEEAGRQLNFTCPLRGSANSGASWKETH